MTFSSISILSRVSLLRRVANFYTSLDVTLKRLIVKGATTQPKGTSTSGAVRKPTVALQSYTNSRASYFRGKSAGQLAALPRQIFQPKLATFNRRD